MKFAIFSVIWDVFFIALVIKCYVRYLAVKLPLLVGQEVITFLILQISRFFLLFILFLLLNALDEYLIEKFVTISAHK